MCGKHVTRGNIYHCDTGIPNNNNNNNNSEDGSRLDVVARDFWGRNRQRAFFDVGVFNPFSRSYFGSQLSRCYQLHEREKRLANDERIREVERVCFSPLVFAATGGRVYI